MKDEEITTFDKSNPVSFKFFDVLNLKKEDIENIGHQLKTMTEKRYPGIKIKIEVPNNNVDDLILYLSNYNDEVNNTFIDFSFEVIQTILKNNYKIKLSDFFDLTD